MWIGLLNGSIGTGRLSKIGEFLYASLFGFLLMELEIQNSKKRKNLNMHAIKRAYECKDATFLYTPVDSTSISYTP